MEKHSRPKAKAHSRDAPEMMHRASPPRNSDMTTAFMDMIPFHSRPGLSNAFPPGKQARPACCPLQDMPGRSARSADTASPAHDAKARPPGIKRPGCIYFVPAGSPRSTETWTSPNAGTHAILQTAHRKGRIRSVPRLILAAGGDSPTRAAPAARDGMCL